MALPDPLDDDQGLDALEVEAPLCPGCAQQPQISKGGEGYGSGLCRTCFFERRATNSAARSRAMAETRIAQWDARTQAAKRRVWTLRQEQSRMERRLKPREAVPPGIDPWVIAEEALEALGAHRAHCGLKGRKLIDLAAERIRWLANGPT